MTRGMSRVREEREEGKMFRSEKLQRKVAELRAAVAWRDNYIESQDAQIERLKQAAYPGAIKAIEDNVHLKDELRKTRQHWTDYLEQKRRVESRRNGRCDNVQT